MQLYVVIILFIIGKMMKMFRKLVFLASTFFIAANTSAAFIQTSASASGDGTFTSTMYGYSFAIGQDASDFSIFHATLTNTSSVASPSPLIDAFAFNMDAALGLDYSIEAINPVDWTIGTSTRGVRFDYLGSSGTPGTRLDVGQSLTFDFNFFGTVGLNDFSAWLGAGQSCGRGFGGGNDCGQVAVSFQQLGFGGQDSDLLASNWDPRSVPEPSAILLLTIGLIAMGFVYRGRARG